MKEKPIIVGRVLGAHGKKGELRVELLSDFPDRFSAGSELKSDEENRLIIESSRGSGKLKIVKIKGIDSREAARKLQGIYLTVDFSKRKTLPPEEFYEYELIGCDVFSGQRKLGIVKDLKKGTAQDLLIIETLSGKESLVPFVKAIVKAVDIGKRRIDVEPIPGLIEE